MTSKRLLLLGGSHAEIPLIVAAKNLGFEVITTGNKPSDLGHPFADKYVNSDFSDVLEMTELASQLQISAICAGCNDFAAISASYVAEQLGLPGHDSSNLTQSIHHKNQFYEMAISASVSVPLTKEVTTLQEATTTVKQFGLPVILKPTDLTGGKGISVVHRLEDLAPAWDIASSISRRNCLVIQQYITGSNHAVSVIISGGSIAFAFFDNEHYYSNKYSVGAASFPTELSLEMQNQIKNSIQSLVDELQLVDGLLHLQFMVDINNQFFFIDVCRRSPGDLYIRFVEMSTGIPYPELIVRAAAGMAIDSHLVAADLKIIGRLCLMPSKTGRFVRVHEIDGPGRVLERLPLMLPGTEIYDVGLQKVEILQIEFESAGEMNQVMNNPSIRFHVEVI
jgi:biotin carboxylase